MLPEPTTDWMQTYTGRQFFPLEPRVADVVIEDIAHALAHQCRYAGHTCGFYSVAEHSVHIYRSISRQNRFWGLMHDAPEAYLVDLIRPIKRAIPQYKIIEENLMHVICTAFGLPWECPQEVHDADNAILNDERMQAMGPPPKPWATPRETLGVKLEFWPPYMARKMFLEAFHECHVAPTFNINKP